MSMCPCGSEKALAACCGPILAGEQPAATAETLMRSRYTAYVLGDLDHLLRSTHPDQREGFDEKAVRAWSKDADWESLEIVGTDRGGPGDDEGTVEFVASFTLNDEAERHHELANFTREGGDWYFVDGEPVRQQPVVRESPKVGRNDPCPCGSGRKFKKCCGRS